MTCPSNQRSQPKLELTVNGRDVAVNDFVQSFIVETILGMLRSLRGVDEVRSVTLTITREQD